MPRTPSVLVALLTIACVPPEAPGARVEALRPGRDAFGVRMIYPTAGRTWSADFTSARTLGPGATYGQIWNRGNGTLRIVGDGTAIATGATQRHYLGDRTEAQQWRNLELTYYARRRDDLSRDELLAGPSGAGITAEVRTGDGHSSGASAAQRCEGRAYGGSFRFYGHAIIVKELQHPNYAPSSAADPAGGSVRQNVWPAGVPLDTWIGFKTVVFNAPGEVVIELYRDVSGGAGGGSWERVLRYVDRPGRWGIPDTPTLCGQPTDRIISEAGPYVIVRNESTEVQYRDLSIREIRAAPVAGSAYVDIGDSIFADAIRSLEGRGAAVPCNPPYDTWFCPDDAVRRDEAAAFLARALGIRSPGGDRFVDDDASPFEDEIEAIAECGISRGCNPPANDRYCPTNAMTRGQMAAFFDRAFVLPAASRDYFTDDAGSPFEAAINRLAGAGITAGCNPPTNDRFCPDDPVTRGQLAAFLARALGRVPPRPGCVCSPAAEVCNGRDDDCDGVVDEAGCVAADAGLARDAGAPGVDAGPVDAVDASSGPDAGRVDAAGVDAAGVDAGPGGPRRDAGEADAGGPDVIEGGCSCRATGARSAPAGPAALSGLLLALLLLRRRQLG